MFVFCDLILQAQIFCLCNHKEHLACSGFPVKVKNVKLVGNEDSLS